MNEHFFIFNGFLFRNSRPIISVGNPAYAFGDGLFETMRYFNGYIINRDLHFSRLFHGMQVLGYQFTEHFFETILENIHLIVLKNHGRSNARVRLMVSRALDISERKNNYSDYLIQTFPVDLPIFKERGIAVNIYDRSTKATGELSNLKSNNYLLNILAKQFATDNDADASLILNCHHRICESAMANIFYFREGKLFTPPLTEGCVEGTIRSWLKKNLSRINIPIHEEKCTQELLFESDEIFLTNAIQWIQPVRSLNGHSFQIDQSRSIFDFMQSELLK